VSPRLIVTCTGSPASLSSSLVKRVTTTPSMVEEALTGATGAGAGAGAGFGAGFVGGFDGEDEGGGELVALCWVSDVAAGFGGSLAGVASGAVAAVIGGAAFAASGNRIVTWPVADLPWLFRIRYEKWSSPEAPARGT